jgi:adenosylmethionine-8-amino-7-oxononanoate aminotransferase
MCVGKALTGGYLSLAATITTSHISETISSGTPGVFMHGPTFMGNALACSVALASTRLLLSSSWEKQVQRIANKLKKALQQLNTLSSVKEVRVLGAIGVVEMREMVDVATLQEQFITEGVWIRPFRNLVYVMPPFVITDEQLETLTGSIIKVLSKNERE